MEGDAEVVEGVVNPHAAVNNGDSEYWTRLMQEENEDDIEEEDEENEEQDEEATLEEQYSDGSWMPVDSVSSRELNLKCSDDAFTFSMHSSPITKVKVVGE